MSRDLAPATSGRRCGHRLLRHQVRPGRPGRRAKADARDGWKCYEALSGEFTRDGDWETCSPILGGLCTDALYPTKTAEARCAGIPAERYTARWSPQYLERTSTERFQPCRPAVTWGCPARCGLHSNLYMDEARHGVPVAAMALTRSWGQVIRCDSGIGEAWRAQHCQIKRLFVAEKFATIRDRNDARRGFARRYKCRVEVVPNDGRQTRVGLLPVAAFVEAAEALHLPAIQRPSETP